MIERINKITENQAKILESFEKRREQHIDWLIHHVGGVLQILIKSYKELISRISIYQNSKTKTHLNETLGQIESCRMFLIQLRVLSELDIPLAAIYISNP
ncbi:MAG TPA: hypothetical protein VJ697_08070 [Nitrososphaeraceae archaeon]|nr:hypothetical protein [Nitrososphaeraceae archaeon]